MDFNLILGAIAIVYGIYIITINNKITSEQKKEHDTTSLDSALSRVTKKMLLEMNGGDMIMLNRSYGLYKYIEEEHYTISAMPENEDIYVVQYNGEEINFTEI